METAATALIMLWRDARAGQPTDICIFTYFPEVGVMSPSPTLVQMIFSAPGALHDTK